MNHKAKNVGMRDTRYVDATGLNPNNVSTAQDLALLVNAGYRYPLLRDYSTTDSVSIPFGGERTRRALVFRNSNGLIRSGQWEIGLQKTGYIRAAGRCLAMQARISDKSVIIVLLDSFGKHTRIADANRIRRWIEALPARLSAPVWHGLNAPSGFSLNATAEGGHGRQVLCGTAREVAPFPRLVASINPLTKFLNSYATAEARTASDTAANQHGTAVCFPVAMSRKAVKQQAGASAKPAFQRNVESIAWSRNCLTRWRHRFGRVRRSSHCRAVTNEHE
jgi:D-alanyl-D-alanine carboxypeptidase